MCEELKYLVILMKNQRHENLCKLIFLIFFFSYAKVPYTSASFMCYGPVVPDGYGCCYNPRPKDILFACSSFKSCEKTNTKDFARVLQQTLCNMRDIGSE